jgi:hypothetical protein
MGYMTESEKISEIDNMGREKFWECYAFIPPQENDGLALKLFQDQCCSNCSCKTTQAE